VEAQPHPEPHHQLLDRHLLRPPAIGWVPTHNQNHHKFNNREGDLSISPRFFKHNHLLAILTYPTVTSILQTPAIRKYIREARKTNPRLFWEAIIEYTVFFGLMITAFVINWEKAWCCC